MAIKKHAVYSSSYSFSHIGLYGSGSAVLSKRSNNSNQGKGLMMRAHTGLAVVMRASWEGPMYTLMMRAHTGLAVVMRASREGPMYTLMMRAHAGLAVMMRASREGPIYTLMMRAHTGLAVMTVSSTVSGWRLFQSFTVWCQCSRQVVQLFCVVLWIFLPL